MGRSKTNSLGFMLVSSDLIEIYEKMDGKINAGR